MFESKLPESLIPKGEVLQPGDRVYYYSSHFKSIMTGTVLNLECSLDTKYTKNSDGTLKIVPVGIKERAKISVDKKMIENRVISYGYTINVSPSKLTIISRVKFE